MYLQSGPAFQVNDYIFHTSIGVCVVQDICRPKARHMDPSRTYYQLAPLYEKGSVIYTPTDNAKAIVRRILSREEALGLIETLPGLEPIWIDNDKYREEQYRNALRTNDCAEWMRVIKTLFLRNEAQRRGGKKISQTDEKYLRMAEDLLYGELAVSLGIPKDKVSEFISRHLSPGEGHCS